LNDETRQTIKDAIVDLAAEPEKNIEEMK